MKAQIAVGQLLFIVLVILVVLHGIHWGGLQNVW